MTELVFKSDRGNPVTNSLLVAEKFEKQHLHVLRDIDSLKKDVSNFGLMFFESTYPDSYGRPQRMYVMSRDGFTLLAMGFTGKKAMSFKLDFLSAFNKMESMLTSDDYILMRSRQILEQKVSQLEAKSEAQTKLIQEFAPKADYYDKTLMSKDAMTTTQIAKELGMSAVALNKKLKDMGIQYKVNEQWVLYAKYQDKGYTKSHTYTEVVNGESRTYISTVWTQKGRQLIHNVLNQEVSIA